MGKKPGRKKIEIDWKKLDVLLSYKMSRSDAAFLVGCGVDTLDKLIEEKEGCKFLEYRNKRMAVTRLNLHTKAVNAAMSGSTTMLIFCLKNMCGWSDNGDQDN